jgi:hypothetical protein
LHDPSHVKLNAQMTPWLTSNNICRPNLLVEVCIFIVLRAFAGDFSGKAWVG